MMNWNEIFATIITSVIVPILIWGARKFMQLADAKIEAINSDLARKMLDGALIEAESAVETAVRETQEIFVKALKTSGEFTQAAADQALLQTIERTRQILSSSAAHIIQDSTDNLNAWIRAKIEATVGLLKIA